MLKGLLLRIRSRLRRSRDVVLPAAVRPCCFKIEFLPDCPCEHCVSHNKPPKIVIILRRDLAMGPGQEIVQACHALEKLQAPRGLPKICVRVDSEDELIGIQIDAGKQIIRTALVKEGSEFTCLAMGPVVNDSLTAHRELY